MGTPALIVADEPTTALDVTVQQQVLDLLAAIRDADDVALVLISHDVTVVGEVCDRVLVMYAGRIVEDLPAAELATRRAASLHAGAGRGGPGHGDRPRPAARDDPGPPGRPGRRTARLRLRRPLPARRRALPRRGPAAGRRTPRAAGSPAGTPASRCPSRRSAGAPTSWWRHRERASLRRRHRPLRPHHRGRRRQPRRPRRPGRRARRRVRAPASPRWRARPSAWRP